MATTTPPERLVERSLVNFGLSRKEAVTVVAVCKEYLRNINEGGTRKLTLADRLLLMLKG